MSGPWIFASDDMSGEVRGHATSLREELKGELTEGERLRKERSLLHHVEHLAVPETKKRAVDLFLFGVFVGLLIGSAVLRAKGVAGSVGVGFGVALGLLEQWAWSSLNSSPAWCSGGVLGPWEDRTPHRSSHRSWWRCAPSG